jgi:hypothetical protein
MTPMNPCDRNIGCENRLAKSRYLVARAASMRVRQPRITAIAM